jgi:hypothetical protein
MPKSKQTPQPGREGAKPSPSKTRKDRLVQARVPRELEETLKEEARRRRLTVSHLVRNVLEDAFLLVDGLVHDVDRIVSDSVTLARSLGRSAPPQGERDGNRKGEDHGDGPTAAGGRTGEDLSQVYAWNEVVLHRAARCSSCGASLARGQHAYAGLSDVPRATRSWLCETCIAGLG